MFVSVVKWWRNVRIGAAYPAYEQEKRLEHERASTLRHSTEQNERAIERLMKAPLAEANTQFVVPASQLSSRIKTSQNSLRQLRHELATLTRDHDSEIAKIEKNLAGIRAQVLRHLASKGSAYDELNEAREDISDWHSSTPIFFTKSVSSLNYSKDAAGEASDKINVQSRAISELKRRERAEMAARQNAFTSRNEKRDLQRKKRTKESLERGIDLLRGDIASFEAEIIQLEAATLAFLEAAREDHGISRYEAEIATTLLKRADAIAEFDSEHARVEREAAQRAEWLVQRQLVDLI